MKTLIKTNAWLSIGRIILSIITVIVIIATAGFGIINYLDLLEGSAVVVLLLVLSFMFYVAMVVISIIILAHYKNISKDNLGVTVAACICSFGMVIPVLGFFLGLAATILFIIAGLRENHRNTFIQPDFPNQNNFPPNPPQPTQNQNPPESNSGNSTQE